MLLTRKPVQRCIAYGVFLLAICSIMVYLWGGLFISEFQSDITDTLLWAQASAESHSLVNPDFFYPYVIPFGGNLLMLPFLSLFGKSLAAIRASMTLFTALLSLAFIAFFDQVIFRSRTKAIFTTGIMLMLFENNRKLREIMFAHIIHYSLAILFVLLMLTFLAMLLRGEAHTPKKRALLLALLSLTCFFCAAEGLAIIALSIVPVLGACVLERILSRLLFKQPDPNWKHEIRVFILLAGAVIAGFAVYLLAKSGSYSSYGDRYFALVSPIYWLQSFLRMAKEWLFWLFRPELYADAAPLAENLSIAGKFFHIAESAFMGASPFVLLALSICQYRRLESRVERIAVLAFWILGALTTGLYTFTLLSSHNWRMIPMLAMMFICYCILLRSMYRSGNKLSRGLSTLMAVVIAVFALNAGVGVLAAKTEEDIWFEKGSLIDTLNAHGLTRGFCDQYRLCSTTEFLSDGKIQMKSADIKDGKLYPHLYQNQISDFSDAFESGRFFFVRTLGLDEPVPEGVVERYRGKTFLAGYLKRDNRYCEYEILVFDDLAIEPYYFVRFGNFYLDADGQKYSVQEILDEEQ